MNLPNRLSLLRVAIIPLFLAALMAPAWPQGPPWLVAVLRWSALAILLGACATDWLDGWLARRRALQTRLGALLDPLADKILVAAALVAFVELGLLWSWVVALILAREFLITGLRLVAAAEGAVLAADRWGKHKTAWQLGALVLGVTSLACRESGLHVAADIAWRAYLIAMGVAVLLTVLSGWLYLRRHAHLLRESTEPARVAGRPSLS